MKDLLSYPELWLLERGINCDGCWLPFALLPDTREERRVGFSEQWNCLSNGLSIQGLSELMWELFQRDELEFRNDRYIEEEAAIPFIPASSSSIQSFLNEECERFLRKERPWKDGCPFQCCCRVTAKGIACWEEYATPDWTRYRGEFDGQIWEPGETIWSQSAVEESFAREVLDVYGTDVFHPATINWETARLVHHNPWVPFRGKQLPRGVTVSVNVTEHGQREFPCSEWEQVRLMDEEHHRRFREICHWYQNGTHNHPDRPRPQPNTTGPEECSS